MVDTEKLLPNDIPGQLISILTFPGIMIHTLGYAIFCKITRVPIYDIRLFHPLKNPASYVRHDKPRFFISTFLIIAGPLLVNTLISMGVFCLALLLKIRSYPFFFLLWLGISIGIHAFPRSGDAGELLDEANERIKNNFLFVFAYPIVLIIYIADILSMVWFDAFYAVGLLFLSSYLVNTPVLTLLS